MNKMILLFILFLILPVYSTDLIEIADKVTSQTISFLKFVTGKEERYHYQMHSVVQFYLYQRKNDHPYELFIGDRENLKKSWFDKSLKTVIFIHGYTDHKDRKLLIALRKALLNNFEMNVILVDWNRGAGQIYFTAVSNTYYVGRVVGDFLRFLERVGVDLNTVHLIGHSLGAHISGIAGDSVEGRIERITGLDPAGPLFEFISERNNSVSLDPNDAKFVDIIHSAIGTFGIIRPIGHADFYPNDGMVPQPGCTNLILAVTCSHARSINYFIESFNTTTEFLSKRCTKLDNLALHGCSRVLTHLVPMGYHAPHDIRGIYYVQTNDKPPYALGGKFFKRPIEIDE